MGKPHQRERQALKRSIPKVLAQLEATVWVMFRTPELREEHQLLVDRAKRLRGVIAKRAFLEEQLERLRTKHERMRITGRLGELAGDMIRDRLGQESLSRKILSVRTLGATIHPEGAILNPSTLPKPLTPPSSVIVMPDDDEP